jgi:hypothetical protein
MKFNIDEKMSILSKELFAEKMEFTDERWHDRFYKPTPISGVYWDDPFDWTDFNLNERSRNYRWMFVSYSGKE